MRPGDGRYATCPLCRILTVRGSLRGHVGSVRCLATAAGREFTESERAILEAVRTLEARLGAAATVVGEGAERKAGGPC